jgi:hypothetical protein
MGESQQRWWKRLFGSKSKGQPRKGGDPCGSREGNRTPTPKEDKEIARRVMAEGDLRHAAFHVGGALFANPGDAEALAMLDQLIARSRDPLSLAPLQDDNWIGTVALRARSCKSYRGMPRPSACSLKSWASARGRVTGSGRSRSSARRVSRGRSRRSRAE